MNVLGLDTATTLTTVAIASGDGTVHELYDEPAPGSRGQHAASVLVLAAAVLERAGVAWEELDLIAVGVGPGGYTGLRIGLATAHGLALAHATALTGVGTLRALAEPIRGATALAVIDARRSELFTAAYVDDVEVLAPRVIAPAELPGLPAPNGAVAVGDGARIYRDALEGAGLAVPEDDSPLHRVSAAAICRIAVAGGGGEVSPLYLRRPDAERSLPAGGR